MFMRIRSTLARLLPFSPASSLDGFSMFRRQIRWANPIEFRGIREMTDPSSQQRDCVIDPSIIVTQPTTVC